MQQSEILSLAERLIPVYGSEDFDFVLGQLTEGRAAVGQNLSEDGTEPSYGTM